MRDRTPHHAPRTLGLIAGARQALDLLPGSRARVAVLILLGVATSVVDTIAISSVVLLLQYAFGTVTPVQGYGALGFVANLGHGLADQGPWLVGLVVFAILISHSCLSSLYEGMTSYVRLQAFQTFRERVFGNWVAGTVDATGRREPGTMVNTIQNETWEAADGVYQYCTLAIAGTIACVYLAVLALTSALLTTVALALGLVAMLLVGIVRRRLSHHSRVSIRQKESLTRHFVSTLNALRTIKAFRAEGAVVDKSLTLSSRLRRTFQSIVVLEAVLKPITDVVHAAVLCAVLLIAAQLDYPATIMLGFVAVLYRAQPRFHAVYQTLGRLARSQVSVQVVAEHLQQPQAGSEDRGRPFPGLRRSIRFEGVTFAYPGAPVPVIRDADLEFERGSLTAILGRSGVGKTTLVSLLLRFVEPTRGAIRCDGEPVSGYTRASWLGRIAVSGQDVELVDGTIRDNLLMGDPDATEPALWRALELAGAVDIPRGLPQGLDAEVGTRGVNLSGGQRQRLCLARALLVPADLLILDEATNAVDALMELAIYRRIRAARPDLTMIVVAHRPAVGSIADRVIMLADGRAVETGAPADLMQRSGGMFAALMNAPGGPAAELP